jgi:lipopolysaccharide/colanic/teichoic acid biosynthesis glycosyltransferase
MDRHIFDEEFFHYSISLERKRAERTHRSFLLILLDLNRVLLDQRNEEILDKIISSISTTVRETDITGWHRSNAVLGFVFTDIPTENRGSIVGALVSRVNGILYNCLGFGRFNQITVSHYVFPDEWDCDVPQRPSNPKLYPDIEKRNHGSKLYLATKRLTDIVGSAFGLALFAPLLLVIALAIKLTSRGPVFFRQQRIGQFGRPFVFLKFRSMYRDNDSRVHRDYVKQLISGKAERQPTKGNGKGVYKLTRDPRVTRVGEFLRRTSLDELPQLYNVLCGEMSLVGPRPAIPYEVEAYEIWHRRRVLEAKPGITGLWQVSGRSRVAFDEMVRLDVRYAVKRSLWMDIRILLLTPWAVIQGEGAH